MEQFVFLHKFECFVLSFLAYVSDIFNAMLHLPKEEIQAAVAELHSITPEPMNRMLPRQPKEAAIAKKKC